MDTIETSTHLTAVAIGGSQVGDRLVIPSWVSSIVLEYMIRFLEWLGILLPSSLSSRIWDGDPLKG